MFPFIDENSNTFHINFILFIPILSKNTANKVQHARILNQ